MEKKYGSSPILGFLSAATETIQTFRTEGRIENTNILPLFTQEPIDRENPIAPLIFQANALGLNPASVCRIVLERLGIKSSPEG